MDKISYKTPFHVKDGKIFDAENRYVTLWGVNYYAPFNHNFYNLAELGKDHCRAIDRDLDDLQLLGADFIRMHMFEREISDPAGNLVENENLRVFDYLLDQCEKRGIYLMLSAMTYWNTVMNQIEQNRLYAYWNIGSQSAFGFTNFYSIDSLIWHPDAIACQERYFKTLFEHRNAFNGKRLCEFKNLVVWELMNEMQFPDSRLLQPDPELTPRNMIQGIYSRGPMRREFQRKFAEFRKTIPEQDEEKAFSEFRKKLIGDYLRKFWGLSNDYFKGSVLNSQFYSYSGIPPEDLKELLENLPCIDAQSLGTYLNAHGFDSVNTDDADHVALADYKLDQIEHLEHKHPLIAYEFDASCTQNGYPLALLAALYAHNGVQLAAYFTYTPYDVAAWNPGWLVHYLNIAHTPDKAAAFAASGRLFRAIQNRKFERKPGEWSGEDFLIRREGDCVLWNTAENYCHVSAADEAPVNPDSLKLVCGTGNSPLVSCDGNGFYQLEKLADGKWRFTLFPAQRYLMEPARGRAFTSMANRYVNCLKELPVSQLIERKVNVRFPMFLKFRCTDAKTGAEIPADGSLLSLEAGTYLIETLN